MSGRPKRSAHIYTAEWGLNYNHLAPCLGLGRKTRDGKRYRTSCTSELHTVLAALSAEVFEAALTRWILAQEVSYLTSGSWRSTARPCAQPGSPTPGRSPAGRLLPRRRGCGWLLTQVARILAINGLEAVTREVVEAAWEVLVIGTA